MELVDKCTLVVDNKTVSFSQKNYQHGKNTAKNENTKKHNEKHHGNKNRIFTATERIGTHWNAQMWSFSEILIKSVPSAWLTHSCMNGKRFRQKFAEKIFCILLFADLRISSE